MFGGGGSAQNIPTETTSLANPIAYYAQITGEYPSDAQIWWAYKRPLEIGNESRPKNYLEVFDPSMRHQISTGNAQVAQGHYLLNAFYKDRSSVSDVDNISVESSDGARPQAVEFHSGRVFYAGVFHPGFNTNVYFSQLIETTRNIGKCYQEADPTAEEIRDLLPTDGGVLEIPDVARVFRMKSLGGFLLVFADNGVWSITGSEGVGFRADDFSVNKMSGVPSIGTLSFVDVEGIPMWWNRAGIYTVTPSERGGLEVVSLTDNSIKTFYQNIPEESKVNAKGTYNPLTKKVEWVYRSTEAATEDELYTYDKSLSFDTETGSWTPWDLSGGWRSNVKGIFTLAGASLEAENLDVINVTDNVLADTDEVIITRNFNKATQTKTKYIVNILSDDSVLPEPPDPPVVETVYVFVSDDSVLVGVDAVFVNL